MDQKKTLGQAIDDIVTALSALEEGARMTAIRAACEHLGLAVPIAGTSGTPGEVTSVVSTQAMSNPSPPAAVISAVAPSSAVHDIRTFKDQKAPGNAVEMACLVAYYLDSLAGADERKKEINSADLEKYFKQAGYKLPKRMPQLLVNAKSSGYFDSAGHGKYKLNPVGYNLVVHGLPKTAGK